MGYFDDFQDQSLEDHKKTIEKTKATLQRARSLIEQYESKTLHTTAFEKSRKNLFALKKIMHDSQKRPIQESHKAIKKHLGEPECFETVREERWFEGIYCPNCESKVVKELPRLKNQSRHNHRYMCLTCGEQFQDDSGTPFHGGNLPIQIWMECWYMYGCSASFSYIATKLGLSEAVVKEMITSMQKLFDVNKPLTRLKSYKDWLAQAAVYQKKLEASLQKSKELHGIEAAEQPKDTAEHRRMKSSKRGSRLKDKA